MDIYMIEEIHYPSADTGGGATIASCIGPLLGLGKAWNLAETIQSHDNRPGVIWIVAEWNQDLHHRIPNIMDVSTEESCT